MAVYLLNSAASAAAAAPTKITTVNGIKTVLQVLHPTLSLIVIEWGVSFDQSTAQAPVTAELCHTTTVAATVTAAVANDVTQYSDPTANSPALTLSTTGTGYNASAEGTVVAPVRSGDLQLLPPSSPWYKQLPEGEEFVVPAAGVLRVRITAAVTTIGLYAYVKFELG